MITLEFRHVDVFSRRAFQGNGLVVVLDADELSEELMSAVTREVRQFETVFLTDVDLERRSAALRIFTEDEELDFAGHPVLGAAALLHTMLTVGEQDQQWALRVAQRTIDVRTSPGASWVDAEEVATGSAAGPAVGYLMRHRVHPDGEPLVLHQGQYTREAQQDTSQARTKWPALGRWAGLARGRRPLPG